MDLGPDINGSWINIKAWMSYELGQALPPFLRYFLGISRLLTLPPPCISVTSSAIIPSGVYRSHPMISFGLLSNLLKLIVSNPTKVLPTTI